MPPKPPRLERVRQMRKAALLCFTLFITVTAFSQKKSNPTIGKNETEITSFILGDNYLAFGAQVVYRLPATKTLKVGAGAMYGANYADTYESDFYGYGALFADVMQFLGRREKWSFGGQLGHGFYKDDYGLKAGIYYSISCNYRAILSERLLFTTSLSLGYRNFHYGEANYWPSNVSFIGLKFGVVF
jgi:hypothetical protein